MQPHSLRALFGRQRIGGEGLRDVGSQPLKLLADAADAFLGVAVIEGLREQPRHLSRVVDAQLVKRGGAHAFHTALPLPVAFLVHDVAVALLAKHRLHGAFLGVEDIHPAQKRGGVRARGGDGEGTARNGTEQVAVNLPALKGEGLQHNVVGGHGKRYKAYGRGSEECAIAEGRLVVRDATQRIRRSKAVLVEQLVRVHSFERFRQFKEAVLVRPIANFAAGVQIDVVIVCDDAVGMRKEFELPRPKERERDFIPFAVAIGIARQKGV